MKKMRIFFYFLIFVSALIIDRVTKIWAIKYFIHKEVKLFNGLNLALVWNRGVTWGLFSFKSLLGFIIVTSIIFLVLLFFVMHMFYLFKKRKNIYFEVLILVGAVSNLIDRFLYKGVADFIDVYIGKWHWPTFNLADVFVVIGVLGIFGRYLQYVYLRKIKRV